MYIVYTYIPIHAHQTFFSLYSFHTEWEGHWDFHPVSCAKNKIHLFSVVPEHIGGVYALRHMQTLLPEIALNVPCVCMCVVQALWRTLHNPDDTVANVAFRVLGKFGGSNRKMISTPQPVSYHSDMQFYVCMCSLLDVGP